MPRGGPPGRVVAGPRYVAPRGGYGYYRGGYRPYYGGYRYHSSFNVGFFGGFGYPFGVSFNYGYPYYRYGYPYRYAYPYYGGYYGYPSAYGYGYPAYPYAYGGNGYPAASYGGGYGYGGGSYGYGGVRVLGAPPNAQVFVDGAYAGTVDDYDGTFQRLNLEAGAHHIEIRAPGVPPLQYDVNVQPGQTLNVHVR